ncbi:MAG TPA: hypothetical protein PLF11_14055 [Bacillota bacterium]|nr:hypothetical protein [Bacillota bacterium]
MSTYRVMVYDGRTKKGRSFNTLWSALEHAQSVVLADRDAMAEVLNGKTLRFRYWYDGGLQYLEY